MSKLNALRKSHKTFIRCKRYIEIVSERTIARTHSTRSYNRKKEPFAISRTVSTDDLFFLRFVSFYLTSKRTEQRASASRRVRKREWKRNAANQPPIKCQYLSGQRNAFKLHFVCMLRKLYRFELHFDCTKCGILCLEEWTGNAPSERRQMKRSDRDREQASRGKRE